MEKRTREKIALVILALLVLLTGGAAICYFATGRAFTAVASFIDDAMGSLEGYTVVVYAGTIEPDDDVDAEDEAGAEDAPSEGLVLEFPTQDEGDGADSERTPADSIGLAIISILPHVVDEDEEGVYVSDVCELYERKGAEVVTLDAADADRYRKPQILYAGDKRIGVYSLDYYATAARLSAFMDYFAENDVDMVVCLATSSQLLANCEGTDVVIVTREEDGIPAGGITLSDTLFVQAPNTEEAGVVVFGSNNVPAAKVISVL